MVLDTSLLNTQKYKVRIVGKVEQFWERSSAPPLHFGVVAIEKGAFWSPSTMVANYNFMLLLILSCRWGLEYADCLSNAKTCLYIYIEYI